MHRLVPFGEGSNVRGVPRPQSRVSVEINRWEESVLRGFGLKEVFPTAARVCGFLRKFLFFTNTKEGMADDACPAAFEKHNRARRWCCTGASFRKGDPINAESCRP